MDFELPEVAHTRTPEVEALLLACGPDPAPTRVWVKVLKSELGANLLARLGVTLSAVEEGLVPSAESMDKVLGHAASLGLMRSSDCSESFFHALLNDPLSNFSQAAAEQREKLLSLAEQRIRSGELTWLEFGDRFTPETEGEQIERCLVKASWIPERIRASLTEQAKSWIGPPIDEPLVLVPSLVQLKHLAFALIRSPAVQHLMSGVGVVPSRLGYAFERLMPEMPGELARREVTVPPRMWVVVPACEEAQRLGHAEVVPDHLLLGLLADDECAASLALVEAGYDLRQLRRQVEAGLQADQTGESRFSEEAKEALAAAAWATQSYRPDSLYLLATLLPMSSHLDESLADLLGRRAAGDLEDGRLEMGGLWIGMLTEDVVSRLGPPTTVGEEEDQLGWSADGVVAVISQGAVRQLAGTEMIRNGRTVLGFGDSRRKAELLLGPDLCKLVLGDEPVWVKVSCLGNKVCMISLEAG
ncbi:MAG: Clp protease N-terminal domain-containing protein [Vulcanimicrobiota bacterium]